MGLDGSRLRCRPGGWVEGGTKKEEKIPHMCESIGHRPLQGSCPKIIDEIEAPYKQGGIHGYSSSVQWARAIFEVTRAFGQKQYGQSIRNMKNI